MGGASSLMSSAGSPRSYSERAKLGKQLPDEILKIFFTRADFKDLLSLASLEKCPAYLFTTVEALKTLFQQFQVEPTLAPGGQIYFAPLKAISPGLFSTTEQNQEQREARTRRDTLCMEIAYYYVRIFQIYAALSLTVMEADPSRRPQFLPPTRQQRKAVTTPVFFGGSIPVPTVGGALKTGNPELNSLTKQVLASLFAPLQPYFSWQKKENTYFMRFDEPSKGGTIGHFDIQWKTLSPGENTLMAYYVLKKGDIAFAEEVVILNDGKKAILRFVSDKNNPIMELELSTVQGKWVFADNVGPEQGVQDTSDVITNFFKNKVEDALAKRGEVIPGRVSGSSGASSSYSYSSSGLVSSTSAGKSSFTGYDSVKELFDKRFKGEEFPKAYCIARAMTLLFPIFETEKGNPKQPYYSQICRKTFDFETIEHMPRAGRVPQANIYLKSLVSLFYDDYSISDGKVSFTQTETGRTDLRNASKQLAYLYNITSSPETFIESQNRFKEFGICENQDVLLQINDKKLKDSLMSQCIKPMIDFQEKHTKAVNDLLKEMFIVKNGELRFSPALRSGGKKGVNAFGKRAANLLLQYYIKSEAYFIRGVLLLENNKSLLSKVG